MVILLFRICRPNPPNFDIYLAKLVCPRNGYPTNLCPFLKSHHYFLAYHHSERNYFLLYSTRSVFLLQYGEQMHRDQSYIGLLILVEIREHFVSELPLRIPSWLGAQVEFQPNTSGNKFLPVFSGCSWEEKNSEQNFLLPCFKYKWAGTETDTGTSWKIFQIWICIT